MTKYIIGVDEVGRGPLAGPVMVAAVLIPRQLRLTKIKNGGRTLGLRDSKKYTGRGREVWFNYIDNHPHISYALSTVSAGVIDRVNIARATNIAATRAVKRLIDHQNVEKKKCNILLDGSLGLLDDSLDYRVIIRGDEKINAIKLASIIAKVKRDRKMVRFHSIYSCYAFDEHKGYGTKKHQKAIKKYGPSKIHRLTFIKG